MKAGRPSALERAKQFEKQNRLAAAIILRALRPGHENGLAARWATTVLEKEPLKA